jgi:starch synthase
VAADLRVLSVASEAFPLIKTGGLADVVGALPAALAAEGVAVRTLLPGYPAVLAALAQTTEVHHWPSLFGGPARLLAGQAHGLGGANALLVIDAPHLYDRPGSPYADAERREWPDNALRFAALASCAAEIGQGLLADWRPDLVHAHDWQAGLVPAYLHYRGGAPGHARGGARPATVFTVHNLAFNGRCPASLLPSLGLPPEAFAIDGVEFYGAISTLKAGLQFADRITTVSPTYATEICTLADGMGFDGLLRARRGVLSGILNGVDTEVWNPATDRLIADHFSAADPTKRATSKRALQARLGLAELPDVPLFAVVSRLSEQKGLDLLLEALPALLACGGQLALLGTGEPALEAGFRAAAAAHPGRVGCVIGYEEDLAHLVQAGADALLVPSRFEPCGLTQLCALRYGAVPIVARVGGLADTVIDGNPMALAAGVATGLQMMPGDAAQLAAAITRAASLYRDVPVWRQIQRNGMACDVSWRQPARLYAALFRDAVAGRRAEEGLGRRAEDGSGRGAEDDAGTRVGDGAALSAEITTGHA